MERAVAKIGTKTNVSSTKDNRLKNLLIIKISIFSSKRRSMTGAKIRVPPLGGRTCFR